MFLSKLKLDSKSGAGGGSLTHVACLEGRNNKRYTTPARHRVSLCYLRLSQAIASEEPICNINGRLLYPKKNPLFLGTPIL